MRALIPFRWCFRGVLIFIVLGAGRPAVAHPMGNFSISHYAGIRVERDGVRLQYRLDFAEIPSVQEMETLDADKDGKVSDEERSAYLARKSKVFLNGLRLLINDQRVELNADTTDLQVRPGSGNLPNLLVTINCRVPAAGWAATNAVEYIDNNFSSRVGWWEIVVTAGDGCWLVSSTASSVSRSKALQLYPDNAPNTAPKQSTARFTFTIGKAGEAPSSQTTDVPQRANPMAGSGKPDMLSELVARTQLTTGLIVFSLLVAFGLGAMHAMSPGHGKTIVAAYLVGSRGTPAHACLLGATVTLTHTIGVFALGLVVLYASQHVAPEALYPWLGFISGMMIVSIGGWQLVRRYAQVYAPPGMAVGHVHGPGGHSHAMPERITFASLVGLGISGGMVPCPSALILLLAAVAVHRVGYGLILTVAFSLGLAAVLIALGLAALYARRLLERITWSETITRRLPIFSSAFVTVLGLVIAVESLASGGVIRLGW